MAGRSDQELKEILEILSKYPEGLSRREISKHLSSPIHDKTLQRSLVQLYDRGQIKKEGIKRATRYFPLGKKSDIREKSYQNFSEKNHREAFNFLEKPLHLRKPVSYKEKLLVSYIPNETTYISKEKRKKLWQKGQRDPMKNRVVGTYAQKIYNRLLIDLSYHSSRLEGNTYSLLETQRLIEEGVSSEGKTKEEDVMIINHKEAISFLVENAQDIQLTPLYIRNLHHLLSQDLLNNPGSCGQIRSTEVSIGGSQYKPLSNPHRLKELLELLLLKAKKIEDSFEQSFFILVHLSYLQAFEDVNKRTARLACNIPFIKTNLCPLSFVDVPGNDYNKALLAVYELNELEPLMELFCWAYLQSCDQYSVIQDSLGQVDSFRIQFRNNRREVMGQIIRNGLHNDKARTWVEQYCQKHNIPDQDKFVAMVITDMDSLHEGNIIGLRVTVSELKKWTQKNPTFPELEDIHAPKKRKELKKKKTGTGFKKLHKTLKGIKQTGMEILF